MKVLLIISILFVGAQSPVSQSQVMPSLEECIAEAHRELLEADKELTPAEKDKIVMYGAQCVISLPQGTSS